MKTQLSGVSVLAVILALGAYPAAAEQSAKATGSSEPNVKVTGEDYVHPEAGSGSGQAAGKSPNEITCREITALDTEAVPGVLYYISGYSAGQLKGGMSGSGDAQKGEAQKSAGTQKSADPQKSGEKQAMTGDKQSAAKSAEQKSGPSASTTGSSASKGATDGQQAHVVAMHGYYTIPVEETIVACREAPESKAADVMQDQKSSGGA